MMVERPQRKADREGDRKRGSEIEGERDREGER